MLAHQRQSDRALIKSAMDTMDMLNSLNGDGLSRQVSMTVKQLIHLEETSATIGDTYQSTVADEDDVRQGEDFRLDVPYFGSISLTRAISPMTSMDYTTWSQPHSGSSRQGSDQVPMSTMSASHPAITPASATGLLEASHMMSQHSLQPGMAPDVASHFAQPYQINYESVYASTAGGPQEDLVMTDLLASGDEWAFQGVDSAFFESFLPAQMRPE